ncbi:MULTISPECIES: hypothetical protein [unclassified Pseudomonas]|uniref:hypothetical protein n=1 Tax=unclassified Pseudomonas TaxID=196821 RepID=UPI002447A8EC|nr:MULTISPECIES: hypothetical protein [unclassified Pseudomonas]MDH0300426.1 hypothetical protein [Pseudomonas sp. GD04091]MDH1987132.1 hypothetical protein [Pseudomonas sp. GD03689]
MRIERVYQVIAHHGIVFDVGELTIQPGTCCQLRQLGLPFVHRGHDQVVEKVVELYERMQVGERPCQVRVAASRPLTREQGDLLNQQRHVISGLVGSAVGNPTGSAVAFLGGNPAGFVAGFAATGAAAWLAQKSIPTFHAGDRLVSLFAKVSGGIGPQSSSMLLIV